VCLSDTHSLCETTPKTGELVCPVYRQLRAELAEAGRTEASLTPVFTTTSTGSLVKTPLVKTPGTKRKTCEAAAAGGAAAGGARVVAFVEGSRRRRTISESPNSEQKVFENREESAERVLSLLRDVLDDPTISHNDLD
jgi:hypothetical protein